MKSKVLMSVLAVALLLATVGTAAAAPHEAVQRDMIMGDVKSIAGTVFTVATLQRGDMSVQTGARTRFRAKDNANFSLADLKVGDRVVVQGRWQDAKLQANVVQRVPDNLRDKAAGKVKAITGSTLAITRPDGSALNVATNAGTKFHSQGIENPTLADIKVGDVIVAAGKLNGDTLTAAQVGFRTPRLINGPFAVGAISAISGANLTLDLFFGETLEVQATGNTLVIKRGENGPQVIKVSNLQTGERVTVIGVRSTDGTSMDARVILVGVSARAGQQPNGNRPHLPQRQGQPGALLPQL